MKLHGLIANNNIAHNEKNIDNITLDFMKCIEYVPSLHPNDRVCHNMLVLQGSEDKFTNNERTLNWRLKTSGRFATYQFDGGHFFYRGQEAIVVKKIFETVKMFEKGVI